MCATPIEEIWDGIKLNPTYSGLFAIWMVIASHIYDPFFWHPLTI